MAHCYHLQAIADAEAGDTVALEGSEAQHAAVARLRTGERVQLTSGIGHLAQATVIAAERRRTELRVESVQAVAERTPRLTLVQALAKGDRAETAVAAATELGVDAIVPWQARRSVVQWRGDKAERGAARWATAAVEASKQAIRPWIPRVAALHDTESVAGLEAQLVVLDPRAERSIEHIPLRGDLAIVVGPEGGLADEELLRFESAGALLVRLGPEVLRTSTAGLAAIAALSPRLGRWGASG